MDCKNSSVVADCELRKKTSKEKKRPKKFLDTQTLVSLIFQFHNIRELETNKYAYAQYLHTEAELHEGR